MNNCSLTTEPRNIVDITSGGQAIQGRVPVLAEMNDLLLALQQMERLSRVQPINTGNGKGGEGAEGCIDRLKSVLLALPVMKQCLH